MKMGLEDRSKWRRPLLRAGTRLPPPPLPSSASIHQNYGRQSEYINGLQSLLLVWPKGAPLGVSDPE